MHKRMQGRLWTCWQIAYENSSTADQTECCTVSGHQAGKVGVLLIRHIHQIPCIPSQFTVTHGNLLTNKRKTKEHLSAHIPRHYVKRKKSTSPYNITTHAFFDTHIHTHAHMRASTSLQCPSPELSPNVCGAQHAQLNQQNLVIVHCWIVKLKDFTVSKLVNLRLWLLRAKYTKKHVCNWLG